MEGSTKPSLLLCRTTDFIKRVIVSRRGSTESIADIHPAEALPIGSRSPRRPRGRSRSPKIPNTNSPAPTRSRSLGLSGSRSDLPVRSVRPPDPSPGADSAVVLPKCLQQTELEILQLFDELAWLERARLRESTKTRDPNCRWAQENNPTTRQRNRYLDVKPWKHNRIHLQVPPGRSDYINASPVTLRSRWTDQVRRYIVTQGPKAGQTSHFWQMVWQETSSPAVIVMLTQCYEADREKCSQYFPDQLNGESMMIHEGHIDEASECNFTAEVRLLAHEAEESSRSVVRKLELRVGTETKIVWHLLFAGWPDWGVPDSHEREALFELIKLSRAKSANPASAPIIHCSAGVGRSGTFITLDYLLSEMDRGLFDMDRGLFDAERSTAPVPPAAEQQTTDIVYETVNKLREQRMLMVQSDAQLLFIYQALREKWLERHGKTEADL